MSPLPHPPGTRIATDSQTGPATQGGPLFLNRQTPRDMAEAKPEISVDTEDKEWRHMSSGL